MKLLELTCTNETIYYMLFHKSPVIKTCRCSKSAASAVLTPAIKIYSRLYITEKKTAKKKIYHIKISHKLMIVHIEA